MDPTRRLLRVALPLSGLALLAAVGWLVPVGELLGGDLLTERRWPVLAAVLCCLYLVRPFFLWPVTAFSVFIGFAFGFPAGVPLALAGTVLTCLPPFLLAARFGRGVGALDWLAGHGATLVDTTGPLRGMVAARLSPTPADVVSYGAGLAGVRPATFVVGTLVGELPWAAFYVVLGESLRTYAAGGLGRVDLRLVALAAVVSVLLVARPLARLVYERLTPEEDDAGSGPRRG